jgi:hypothetical protein
MAATIPARVLKTPGVGWKSVLESPPGGGAIIVVIGVMAGVPTAAHAFVPVALAAIIGRSVLGAALRGAAYNANAARLARSPTVVATSAPP